ncbi:hypothetical protein [Providencia sp. JUb39]|uniref:hypothetical protein n=1 Tax=Providencia sp. JUb39 TaxID=2724165 RepID=UPI00164CE08E|nr:hypothetical protein [Providencia sp. JUb39]MBC5788678.1 hypothetical protein [Providencia sp. JUb39]
MATLQKYIYILLLTLSSAASVVGMISYISLTTLIILHFFHFKSNKLRLGKFLILISYFLILLTIAVINKEDRYLDLDLSVINIFLQLMFLITLPKSHIVFDSVKLSLLIQLLLSFLLCLYGLFFHDYSMFVDSKYTKGYDGLLIPTGIYSTPQALASVGLIVFFFNKEKIKKYIGVLAILSSLNRTSYSTFLITIFLKSNKKLILLSFLSFLLVFLYIYNLSDYINLRTIISRLNLLFGAYSQINTDSLITILFGSWNKIEFYLPMYNIYKNYIENGYLFIFYHFGVIGLLVYIFYGIPLLLSLMKAKKNEITFLFFSYYFINPIMTHEYLITSFYQILFVFYFYSHNRNEENK